jgi:hypothetical protein
MKGQKLVLSLCRICAKADCTHDAADTQAAGRVTLFRFREETGQIQELLTISGSHEFGGLGSSLAFANMTIHGR